MTPCESGRISSPPILAGYLGAFPFGFCAPAQKPTSALLSDFVRFVVESPGYCWVARESTAAEIALAVFPSITGSMWSIVSPDVWVYGLVYRELM